MTRPDLVEIVRRAFVLQRQGRLDAAEALYREVLRAHPDHADALHMLGVLCLRQRKYVAGIDLVEKACIASGWRHRSMFANLVRGLEHLVAALGEPADLAERRRAVDAQRADQAALRAHEPMPLVSVLLPSHNHARFVRQALRSVFAQTYGALELVVLDDGSSDGSAQLIHEVLAHAPIRSRFVARPNRGAPATINEALTLASGRYVNILNSDDLFAAHRIETMVRAVHRSGADWGFARCALIDEQGEQANDADRRVAALRGHTAALDDARVPIGHRFLSMNPALSTGNLFVATALARAIRFPEYRYNHDWAFCLDAVWRSEPVFVAEALYAYRLHGANTISEPGNTAAHEADAIVANYLARARRETAANPLAMSMATSPATLALTRLVSMRGIPSSAAEVRELVQRIRDEASRRRASAGTAAAAIGASDAPMTMV